MSAEHALLIILYLEALQANMISILCIIIGSSGCLHLNSRARIVGFFWDANLSQAAQAIKTWVAESICFFSSPKYLLHWRIDMFNGSFHSWFIHVFSSMQISSGRSSASQFLLFLSPISPNPRTGLKPPSNVPGGEETLSGGGWQDHCHAPWAPTGNSCGFFSLPSGYD